MLLFINVLVGLLMTRDQQTRSELLFYYFRLEDL